MNVIPKNTKRNVWNYYKNNSDKSIKQISLIYGISETLANKIISKGLKR